MYKNYVTLEWVLNFPQTSKNFILLLSVSNAKAINYLFKVFNESDALSETMLYYLFNLFNIFNFNLAKFNIFAILEFKNLGILQLTRKLY